MRFTVCILTVSDRCSRGEEEDRSGPFIAQWLTDNMEAEILELAIVPDEQDQIARQLIVWSDELTVDLILTTGGTGFSPRDVTPEATRQAIEREAPGLPEAMRFAGLAKTSHAMLSRAIAGIRSRTLIINLPGSPKAVRDGLETLLPALGHGIEIVKGIPEPYDRHRKQGA